MLNGLHVIYIKSVATSDANLIVWNSFMVKNVEETCVVTCHVLWVVQCWMVRDDNDKN